MHLPRHFRSLPLLVLSVAALSACGASAPGAAAAPATPAAGDAAASTPSGTGACRLLTTSEVREALPGVGEGEVDENVRKLGIDLCQWSGDHGRFTVQVDAGQDSAEQQVRGLATGFVDPAKPQAEETLRYETFEGVGDGACAVIERRDAARGILANIAIVVARRGGQSVTLMSDSLSHGDRAATLAALKTLAIHAVGRL